MAPRSRVGKTLGDGRVWMRAWIVVGCVGLLWGVATFIWHQLLDRPREASDTDHQTGSLLGPKYSDDEIRAYLDSIGAVYHEYATDDELCGVVSDLIASDRVVGWFQGRMEFGPRALGSRSIIGDARSQTMQSTMNLKIKFRESFRPFAPSILKERVHEYFEMRPQEDSPYMLIVAPVLASRRIGQLSVLV